MLSNGTIVCYHILVKPEWSKLCANTYGGTTYEMMYMMYVQSAMCAKRPNALARNMGIYLPYARGQACKRESMLIESKFGEIMN
jgi:hypothetical protein